MFKNDYRKINNKAKYIIKAVLIVLLFLFIDYVNIIPIRIFNITEFRGPVVVILDTFKNIIMASILFLIYRKELIKEWDTFRSDFLNNIDSGVKYWFVGLFIMVTSNLLISVLFNSNGAGNEATVQNYISYLPWLMFIDAGIIGPFIEEMVFRKSFRDATKNKWVFALVSALVFGGMHVITNVSAWYDILYIIPYGALGGAFALAYYETDTIFTPITIHMLHNSVLTLSSIITTLLIIF